jgi:abequosyltransferase
MSKLLTISIPTYNRAMMLRDQLIWFASEIKGFEDVCNLVVNDNCSTDDTSEVVELWKSTLDPAIDFTYNCHVSNLGGMANIVSCLKGATGKFVWTLGDDDPVNPGAISFIISKIREHEDLSLILLNGNGRDKLSNKIIVDRWFHKSSDVPYTGLAVDFEYFLENHMGGVLFVSSAIYRAEYVQQALSLWPDSARNLGAQAFWVAYTANRGSFIVTPQLFTECAMGIGFTDRDPQFTFKLRFNLPEVYLLLMRVGYSRKFCYRSMVVNLRSIGDWRVLIGSLKRWPIFAARGFKTYIKNVVKGTSLLFTKQKRLGGSKELPVKPTIASHGHVGFDDKSHL